MKNHIAMQPHTKLNASHLFWTGIAAGTLLALGATVPLVALTYWGLGAPAHWPIAVLVSAAANFLRLYLDLPAISSWCGFSPLILAGGFLTGFSAFRRLSR